jgi:hypothetical protein
VREKILLSSRRDDFFSREFNSKLPRLERENGYSAVENLFYAKRSLLFLFFFEIFI